MRMEVEGEAKESQGFLKTQAILLQITEDETSKNQH